MELLHSFWFFQKVFEKGKPEHMEIASFKGDQVTGIYKIIFNNYIVISAAISK